MSKSRIFYHQRNRLNKRNKRKGIEKPLNIFIIPTMALVALKDSRTRKPVPDEWIDASLINLKYCYDNGLINKLVSEIFSQCKKPKSHMSKLFINMLKNHNDPYQSYALIGNYLDKKDDAAYYPIRINNGKATFISTIYSINKISLEHAHASAMQEANNTDTQTAPQTSTLYNQR